MQGNLSRSAFTEILSSANVATTMEEISSVFEQLYPINWPDSEFHMCSLEQTIGHTFILLQNIIYKTHNTKPALATPLCALRSMIVFLACEKVITKSLILQKMSTDINIVIFFPGLKSIWEIEGHHA